MATEVDNEWANVESSDRDDLCDLLKEVKGRNTEHRAALRIKELEAKVAELDRELRQERGLKALLANGMPPTGNEDFDKVLATQPIAAMIQRGWLSGVTGFDDLPALESAICFFWGVKTIAEAVDPEALIAARGREGE